MGENRMKTEFAPQRRAEIYEEAKGLLNENNGLCEVLDYVLRDRIGEDEYRNYCKWLDYNEFIPLYFSELEMIKPGLGDLKKCYWWPMGAEIRREKLDEMIELTKIK
jgi:hypothetical protein